MLRLFEQQTKKVSFTFGRFNPPTTGHEKLIKALAAQGGTIMVFPSQTQDPKKNPLPFPKKVAYMRKMFPRYAKNIIVSKARQVFTGSPQSICLSNFLPLTSLPFLYNNNYK